MSDMVNSLKNMMNKELLKFIVKTGNKKQKWNCFEDTESDTIKDMEYFTP